MDSNDALRRRDSAETSISMHQIDPSPIETPPAGDKDRDMQLRLEESRASNSSARTGSTTAGPGLGSSGHSAVFYLTRIQKYSSYAVSIFSSLHLANVSLIPAITRSVAGSETYLLMTREIYQTTFTEPLLVGLPILAHITSGIALRLIRRSQNLKRYGGATPGKDGAGSIRTAAGASPWPRLSYISISGYALSVFLSAHVFMNRVLPLAVDGDSSNVGLAYVAHGFAKHPLVASMAYGGIILVGAGHMVWGAARWLGLAPSSDGLLRRDGFEIHANKVAFQQRRRKWLQVTGVALGASLLWAVGGIGVVARGGQADGWVGKLYDDLFARVDLHS